MCSRWRNGWLFLEPMQRYLIGLPPTVSGGGTWTSEFSSPVVSLRWLPKYHKNHRVSSPGWSRRPRVRLAQKLTWFQGHPVLSAYVQLLSLQHDWSDSTDWCKRAVQDPINRLLFLDPASFRAANCSEGGSSLSSASRYHPSCSPSCCFLQAYREDPQEDPKSIKAACREEANLYPWSGCIWKWSHFVEAPVPF